MLSYMESIPEREEIQIKYKSLRQKRVSIFYEQEVLFFQSLSFFQRRERGRERDGVRTLKAIKVKPRRVVAYLDQAETRWSVCRPVEHTPPCTQVSGCVPLFHESCATSGGDCQPLELKHRGI